MQCENCNENKAILVVKEIIMGKEKDMFLCESCALEKGFSDVLFNPDLKIENFILGLMERDKELKEKLNDNSVCSCGHSVKNFLETGKMGCPNCFATFEDILKTVYLKIFGTGQHEGKVPGKFKHSVEMVRQVEKYNRELEEEIGRENYERAAYLRDKIKELNKQIEEK